MVSSQTEVFEVMFWVRGGVMLGTGCHLGGIQTLLLQGTASGPGLGELAEAIYCLLSMNRRGDAGRFLTSELLASGETATAEFASAISVPERRMGMESCNCTRK